MNTESDSEPQRIAEYGRVFSYIVFLCKFYSQAVLYVATFVFTICIYYKLPSLKSHWCSSIRRMH